MNQHSQRVEQIVKQSNERIQQLKCQVQQAMKQGNLVLARQYASEIQRQEQQIKFVGSMRAALGTTRSAVNSAKMIKETAALTREAERVLRRAAIPSAAEVQRSALEINRWNERLEKTSEIFEDYADSDRLQGARIDEIMQQAQAEQDVEFTSKMAQLNDLPDLLPNPAPGIPEQTMPPSSHISSGSSSGSAVLVLESTSHVSPPSSALPDSSVLSSIEDGPKQLFRTLPSPVPTPAITLNTTATSTMNSSGSTSSSNFFADVRL